MKAGSKDAGAEAALAPPPNWPTLGGDDSSTFSTVDVRLSRTNVAQLQRAWSVSAQGVTSTPLIYDGVVYFTDWAGGVYAVGADKGDEVWTQHFDRGFTSSPFVTADRLYLSDRDALVRALDRKTGQVLWTVTVNDNPITQLWSSPVLAGDVLIVGVGGKGTVNGGVSVPAAMLMSFRGSVVGLSAKDGKLLWRFETTKADGKADGMDYGPGVSVWSSATVDQGRGLAFIGTGNSYYSPASPYSDSLLALEYATGKLVWSQQFTKDDNYTTGNPRGPDSDVGATPNLFAIAGMDVVGVGDKAGNYYVLSRDTGEIQWMAKITGGSSIGGVIAPAAYGNGIVYVMSNKNYSTSDVVALEASSGKELWRKNFSGVTFGAPALVGSVLITGTTSLQASASVGAKLSALDINDGSELWSDVLMPERAGGASIYGTTLLTGYGFHFENDKREPLMGGVQAYRLGGTGGTSQGTGAMQATGNPTFSAVYREVFAKYACTTPFCHGAGGNLALDTQETAYTNLVGVDAMGPDCGPKKLTRVVPDKPEESLLWLKLGAAPPCGERMPRGGMITDAAELEQIRKWIENGAKND